jgi:predicted NAD/FAD-binding protein
MTARRYRIAVLGAGAAGLTAAYLLQRRHDVTLYEKARELGGHAHTVVIDRGPDAGTALDVGFMVLNPRNYPTLYRLLAQLDGVETADCEMSFAYYSPEERAGYVVNCTLNPTTPIDEGCVVRPLSFTHPTFTFRALEAREELRALNGCNRTFYCGSYFGHGFHEDAVRSGVAVAETFGSML